MSIAPRLIWENPRPQPHLRLGAAMLRFLADELADLIRADRTDAARGLAAIHHLSPLALAYVATQLSDRGIDEDAVLKIFG